MAFTLIEGFGKYNDVSVLGLRSRWDEIVNTSIAFPASDAYAQMQVQNQSNPMFNGGRKVFYNAGYAGRIVHEAKLAAKSNFAIGFSYQLGSTPYPNAFFGLMDGSTCQFQLEVATGGDLYVRRPPTGEPFRPGTFDGTGSAVGNVSGVINYGWQYVELVGNIGTNGNLKIYVNGTEVLNLTNVNLSSTGSTQYTGIAIGAGYGASSGGGASKNFFDDIYVNDVATRVGDMRVQTLDLTGDTSQKNFTVFPSGGNWAAVDEVGSDGDTTYVSSSTVGHTDRYTVDGITFNIPPSKVFPAVAVSAIAKKVSGTGSRELALVLRAGSTQTQAAGHFVTDTYRYYQSIFATNPATAGSWDKDGVNTITAGHKVQSGSSSTLRTTALIVEVLRPAGVWGRRKLIIVN
jgi:hypothetical protein